MPYRRRRYNRNTFEEAEGFEEADRRTTPAYSDDGFLYRRQRREHCRDAGVGRCVVGHVVAVICDEVLEDCGKVHAGRLGAEAFSMSALEPSPTRVMVSATETGGMPKGATA